MIPHFHLVIVLIVFDNQFLYDSEASKLRHLSALCILLFYLLGAGEEQMGYDDVLSCRHVVDLGNRYSKRILFNFQPKLVTSYKLQIH